MEYIVNCLKITIIWIYFYKTKIVLKNLWKKMEENGFL